MFHTIKGGGVYNAIVDHVSMGWANDEIAQIWSSSVDTAPYDITYSWNIIAEGIAGHSTGFIAGSYDNTKISRMFLFIIIYLLTPAIDCL